MATRRSLRSIVVVVVSVIVGLVVAPGHVLAHTEFDYSTPADGASVGAPVDEIVVAFTSPVALVGDGFAVLDPQNAELAPVAVTDDDTVFRLQFDPPLAGGTVGVKYEVRAEDGHVLTGNFVFVVDAPAPTTSASTTSSPAPTMPTAPTGATTPTTPPADTSTATTDASTPPVTDDVTAAPATSSPPPPTAETGDDGGSPVGIVIALAVAAVLAVGGVVLVRSRTAT